MTRWLIGALLALAACSSDDPAQGPTGGAGAGGPTSTSTASTGSGLPPSACDGAASHEGEATYYDADGTGNCSFDASPNDLMVAALNTTDYAGSAACGACARVEGPAGTVDVRIVDRCPGCAVGDIDLSPQAFEQIAPLADGRVAASWRFVPCNVDGPVGFHFKEGSNEFWTAVQVRNHRHAIATFGYRNAGGDLVDVDRLDYNYFVADEGMGPGPYTFVVTDVEGNSIEASGVAFAEAQTVAGTEQFPACM